NHGSVVTKLRVGNRNIDVRLKYRKEDINSIDKILATVIKTPKGDSVRLSEICKVTEKPVLSSILRSGNSRVNLLTANLNSGQSSQSMNSIENYLAELKLPEGFRVQFFGEKENISKSFRELAFAFVIASILIYMLLAGQFESLKYSTVMVLTIPLIFIGTLPALFIFDKSLNVSSFMGLVLLLGVVVDNATLYYEYVEIILKENIPLKKAIIDSGRIVLRPILMNNGTTVMGLFPILLEFGSGSEFQSPMAVVVISGLISSVFFSLYLIPVIFYLLLKKESDETALKTNS
ncbi:MAG: efflux RND transporter permease subunit, partial [Leptospira sp.]|nr:efflux RND transporter permease subunit [Leptospira sp.]